MNKNFTDRKILDLSLSFLTMFCFVFIGTAIFMFLDKGIGVWQFPVISLIGIIIYSYFRVKEDSNFSFKRGILYYLIYILLINLISLISQSIWDGSVDGRWYHSEAILRLTDGWNPIYYKLKNVDKWSYYYCKSTWYTAANIKMFLGDMEKSKLYNIFFEITTIILSIPFIKNFFNTKTFKIPIIGAIIFFLNPIAWSQRFTFYQDSTLGLLLIMLIMISFFVWKDKSGIYRKSNFFALFCVAAFLANVKFTGLAYASLYLFLFLIFFIFTRNKEQSKKLFLFLLSSFLIITIVLGFSPYVKNTIENKNPFYPLIGKDTIDIMTPNTPQSIKDMNYLEKFIASQYLSPEGDLSKKYSFKYQDLFEMKDKRNYMGPDSRIRGFGIISFILMPLTIILTLLYIFIRGKNKAFFFVIVLSVILTGIFSKEIWWARYFSYFWIMPVMVTCAFFNNKSVFSKFLAIISFIVIVINGVHYIFNSVPYQIEKSDITKLEVENYRLNGTNEQLSELLNKNLYRLWFREKLGYSLKDNKTYEEIEKRRNEDLKHRKEIEKEIEFLKEKIEKFQLKLDF